MAEKLDKKNDGLFPFQTYTFRNTTEMETMCPSAFDMMLNSEHEHELWIGNINGLVSPTSEYGLAIKLKGYIIAGKKLSFILPENYEAIRPDNGNIGFRKTVLDMIRLGESRKQITIFTYSIEHAEEDINKILKDIKETDMKFDVAIMNPPYDGNLHLKILEKVIPIADKVVNISPIRWLQDPIVEYKKNTDYAKYEESILKHMIDFIELEQTYTNDCFGIQFNTKIGISVYDKTGGYDYKKIHESEFNEIYKKCMTKKERITPNIKLYKNLNSKNFVPVCLLGGHVNVNGYGVRFTRNRYKYFIDGKCQNSERPELYNKEPNEVKSYNLKTFDTVPCVEFDTAEETKNFYNYINSICFQYLTRGHTQDGHIYPKLLPFPTDYTNNWNDKLVCEYFGITGYIDDDHAEPGTEWETILKTMEQYK